MASIVSSISSLFDTATSAVSSVTTTTSKNKVTSSTKKANNTYTYPSNLTGEDSHHANFLVMRSMQLLNTGGRSYIEARRNFSQNKNPGAKVIDTINIYMPSLTETLRQNYDEQQHSLLGQAINEISTTAVEAFNNGSTQDIGKTAARSGGMLIGSGVRAALGIANDVLQQQTGKIVTPNIVSSYKGPSRRMQTLVFNFYPRSLAELKSVANIIKAVYRGALPGSTAGDTATGTSGVATSAYSSILGQSTAGDFQSGFDASMTTYSIPSVWFLEEVSAASYGFSRYTPRFIFGPAGITDIRLNKTPDQYWRTFSGTAGDSAAIELEITFAELFPLDAQTYELDVADGMQSGMTGA